MTIMALVFGNFITNSQMIFTSAIKCYFNSILIYKKGRLFVTNIVISLWPMIFSRLVFFSPKHLCYHALRLFHLTNIHAIWEIIHIFHNWSLLVANTLIPSDVCKVHSTKHKPRLCFALFCFSCIFVLNISLCFVNSSHRRLHHCHRR